MIQDLGDRFMNDYANVLLGVFAITCLYGMTGCTSETHPHVTDSQKQTLFDSDWKFDLNSSLSFGENRSTSLLHKATKKKIEDSVYDKLIFHDEGIELIAKNGDTKFIKAERSTKVIFSQAVRIIDKRKCAIRIVSDPNDYWLVFRVKQKHD